MRIWIFSVLLISLVSCKKETSISNAKQENPAIIHEQPAKDSLASKPTPTQIFHFVTELCESKGYYDANKYSREELEGTYKLWFQNAGISLSTLSVFNINNLQEVRRDKDLILARLDKDFASGKKILENLKTVNIPYWQNIKKQYNEELRRDYEKKKLQIESYTNPSVLINNTFTGNCRNFAKALNSNDAEMIVAWRKLREEMSKINGDPQRIINEFENHLHSSDWKDYATIDLITFGWGNCANADIQRPSHNMKMNNEFNSLFIKIDSQCDEP